MPGSTPRRRRALSSQAEQSSPQASRPRRGRGEQARRAAVGDESSGGWSASWSGGWCVVVALCRRLQPRGSRPPASRICTRACTRVASTGPKSEVRTPRAAAFARRAGYGSTTALPAVNAFDRVAGARIGGALMRVAAVGAGLILAARGARPDRRAAPMGAAACAQLPPCLFAQASHRKAVTLDPVEPRLLFGLAAAPPARHDGSRRRSARRRSTGKRDAT